MALKLSFPKLSCISWHTGVEEKFIKSCWRRFQFLEVMPLLIIPIPCDSHSLRLNNSLQKVNRYFDKCIVISVVS